MSSFSLVYSSQATRPLNAEGLMALLEEARAFNAEHQITGILLHENGTFLQLLEGNEQDVNELYGRIRNDPRHHEVRTVWVSTGAEPHFTHWSMAFADFADTTLDDHPAFSNLLTTQDTITSNPDRRADLLAVLESSLKA
ncbi:BLUF domain-containing protein [Naumannella halotolerans]|uniref:FAD-dependent sensor of blue light n=1 Tax=Naumannella halotolerans TaxID=993414 RepID=A0A4R7JAF6_9ACTN|nr:BLUF domain-containing protein [Naumannella halotolerans]TDT33533.1 FAD-dependent sensor of blue light [Naumannella halotolerans]